MGKNALPWSSSPRMNAVRSEAPDFGLLDEITGQAAMERRQSSGRAAKQRLAEPSTQPAFFFSSRCMPFGVAP